MIPIITSVYEEQLARNGRSEKDVTISKAANIIPASKENYPSAEMVSDVAARNDFLPKSLYRLLSEIFTEAECELKIASIGQAIVQGIRPWSIIAPLQIGLGVQLHHQFKSV